MNAFKILLLMTLLIVSTMSNASHPEKRGFWWGESIETTDDDQNPEVDTMAKPPSLPERSKLMQMPPQQIKRMMQERLDYALYAKTPDATLDYMILKDIARRNARIHASLTGFVLANNPELNPRAQYPITNLGIAARKKVTEQRIKQRLAQSRQQYALILLTDRTCAYCPVQRKLLANFSRLHRWEVKEIDITQNPEVAAHFNTQMTPTTVLIKKNSDQWQPIAVGIESIASIESNLSAAVRLWEGDIRPEQFYTQEHDEGGYFDPLSFMDQEPRYE